jgi:hypothetical protein
MAIIYRIEKGSPLSVAEIDGNFKELNDRLTYLEEHPEIGEGIERITVKGDQMTITGAFGTEFGTFELPKALLKPSGPWSSQILYQKLNLVTFENALFCCVKEHTSTTWEQNKEMWQETLSLPKPVSTSLPLYEKNTLPKEESLGKIGLLLGEEEPSLIFFNGKTWQRLTKGENL